MKPSFSADLHSRDSLVPALDDLAPSQMEGEGLPVIERGVKLLSVGCPARVMHGHGLAGFGHGAFSFLQVLFTSFLTSLYFISFATAFAGRDDDGKRERRYQSQEDPKESVLFLSWRHHTYPR